MCTAHRDVATARRVECTARNAFVTLTGGRWSPAAEACTTEYLTSSEVLVDSGTVQHPPASSPPSTPTGFVGGREVLQPLDDNVGVAEAPERLRGRPVGQRPAPVWQCACGARATVRAGSDDESRVCWNCFTAILHYRFAVRRYSKNEGCAVVHGMQLSAAGSTARTSIPTLHPCGNMSC